MEYQASSHKIRHCRSTLVENSLQIDLFMQNKPNFRKAKTNVSFVYTKDYRKNDTFAVQKNKPNSNPIFLRTKTNATLFATRDYGNKPPLRTPAKQTQFKPKKPYPAQNFTPQIPPFSKFPIIPVWKWSPTIRFAPCLILKGFRQDFPRSVSEKIGNLTL